MSIQSSEKTLCPGNDLFLDLNNVYCLNPLAIQSSAKGIADTKATDQKPKTAFHGFQRLNSEASQGLFRSLVVRGHQKNTVEDDLVNRPVLLI